MQRKYYLGLLLLSGLFLLTRILKSNSKTITDLKVPEGIKNAFDQVFKSSPYYASENNWIAISKMETAAWTSNLFKNAINLWGMKLPKVRPTTAAGQLASGNNFWARYNSLNDSVKDIILWMEYTKFPKQSLSLTDHIEEMKKRGYFEESIPQYTKLVEAWLAK